MASDTLTYTDSMNLKVKELLKEVQLEYSPETTATVDKVVSAIKEAIDKIPEDQVTADLAPGFVRDIKADKVEFTFKKPKSLEISGSYSIQCVTKPDLNVDLFLHLPKECFYEKDYLNYRYHAKRFLYLCKIKEQLKKSPLIRAVRWSSFQNEARKPILLIYPAVKLIGNAEFVVRIIPTATSLFSATKLRLERNNIRTLKQGDALQATPRYNNSILEDLFLEGNAEFVKRTFSGWKELGEALILLKVWARQRSSIYAHDCLNGFLISVILAFLATKPGRHHINSSMNTMQIFRITVDFIATSKTWDKGLFIQPQHEKASNKDMQLFPVVICNSFEDFNLAFRLSHNGFEELRNEAALAVNCINKCGDGGFDELFITKIDFPARYDYCVRLNLRGNSVLSSLGFCLDDEFWRSQEQKVLSLMDQGLRDRSKSVRVIWRNTASECNFEEGLSELDNEPLLIGMSVKSAELAFKMTVIGPSPEERDKALEFRKFWGEKATLRQFRDSRIAEVAVWEREEWERHLIIKDIAEHILSRHLSIPKEKIIPIGDQLDFCLLHRDVDPISFSKSLLVALEELSKRLLQLNDIPLKVSTVQPLDSAFRMTSVFPPMPHPLAQEKGVDIKLRKPVSTCINPVEVMIQLEGSGNWPMDEIAIEKTKTAFLLRIAESLQNNWGMMFTATEDDVDVLMSGYAFRLKISHERALSLVTGQSNNSRHQWSLSADRELLLRHQHASKINALRGRYPVYGPIVRLAKRWVSAHLFSTVLTEEAVELLVSYLFLRPLPFEPTFSRITGFLRFLRLLSEYDWAFSPLIVDFDGDFSTDEKNKINENFMRSREEHEKDTQNLGPAMFLATKYDVTSEAWTRSSPTTAELRRLVTYSTSSVNLLTKLILQDGYDSYGWKCLLRTPLNNYDAVVLLHRDKLPYPQHLLFPSELKQERCVVRGHATKIFHPFILPGDFKVNYGELKSKLMVNFDPIRCFITDIQRGFPDVVKVWHDALGGDALGLTLGKASSKKRKHDDSTEESKDLLNTLRTIGEVGKGLVRSIHVVKALKRNN
uniref:Nucleolar protein 6 n=1 Tax=Nicotiana tabacum TaxID=4097 RepID=A0A1S3YJZ9_TOBAC|nr:PREDICTED: nucleolar protein 6 [Nicotiana tabacum]XP_016452560.1 PREDICTED: nucleolar protein 6 [Nicotiana tabacum]XP_016452561.1 PREDICTED: nucleolar protein 6 [Nicotiana tabacum]